jgi:hypothetical protein
MKIQKVLLLDMSRSVATPPRKTIRSRSAPRRRATCLIISRFVSTALAAVVTTFPRVLATTRVLRDADGVGFSRSISMQSLLPLISTVIAMGAAPFDQLLIACLSSALGLKVTSRRLEMVMSLRPGGCVRSDSFLFHLKIIPTIHTLC